MVWKGWFRRGLHLSTWGEHFCIPRKGPPRSTLSVRRQPRVNHKAEKRLKTQAIHGFVTWCRPRMVLAQRCRTSPIGAKRNLHKSACSTLVSNG